MKYASIGPIAVYFPEKVETNEELAAEYPEWHIDRIEPKTGIKKRHIAAEGELSSDLAVKAAEQLFEENDIDRSTIDYLLFCTQSPDYPLPTTACLLQDRLNLPTSIGAIDFNLGCSGYVYGLSLADGLIRSGAAKRVLFITAETYSKFIDPSDRSLRTIFGDAAAATLIEASDEPSLTHFQFGTDGSGADTLLATEGGFRPAEDAIQPRGRKRWPSNLYMDGASLMTFTVNAIPKVISQILTEASLEKDQIQYYLMHQATRKMLERLRTTCGVGEEKIPIRLESIGNTVSCTLPVLIEDMRSDRLIDSERQSLLVGFGVGWSWAACVWQDNWTKNR